MTFFELFGWICLGVIISIVLPVLRSLLPFGASRKSFALTNPSERWKQLKPIAVLAAFSLSASLVLSAFAGDAVRDWRVAFLLGYAWDSTLQKLR